MLAPEALSARWAPSRPGKPGVPAGLFGQGKLPGQADAGKENPELWTRVPEEGRADPPNLETPTPPFRYIIVSPGRGARVIGDGSRWHQP